MITNPDLDKDEFKNLPKFYLDSSNQGIVRGGWFDQNGGLLAGVRAVEICDALNHVRLIADYSDEVETS